MLRSFPPLCSKLKSPAGAAAGVGAAGLLDLVPIFSYKVVFLVSVVNDGVNFGADP